MKNQKPAHVAANSSAEFAEGDKLEKVRSNVTNHSAADTICVEGGPSAYMSPGVPRVPFVRLYEGDALSWGPIADEIFKEAHDAYDEAFRGPGPHQSGYIRQVLAAAAAVPGRLKWLASGQWARSCAQCNTLPPQIVDEVRTMVSRESIKVQMAEYGRMARVLSMHTAEVKRVMGHELVKSMGYVAMRMYERAVHENYGVAHVVSTAEYVGSDRLGASAVYSMKIPDCKKCGLYGCRRCGKSRQLQLIELYKDWEEPVVMVVRRFKVWLAKEERRLLDAEQVEIAKARYGKTW